MSIKQQGGIFGRNPTFNDVDVDGTLSVNDISVDGSLALDNVTIEDNKVSSSSGSLLIQGANNLTAITQNDPDVTNTLVVGVAGRTGSGITNTTLRLEAMGNVSGANRGSHYTLTAAGTSAWGGSELRFGYFNDGVDYGTRMTLTNGGNLSFPSGKGIDFSATSGTGTSELFDDYEEGTWVPTIGGTASYLFQQGRYTKIGRIVVAEFDLQINTIGTGNPKNIFGLPFASSSSPGGACMIGYYTLLASNVYSLSARIDGGGTSIALQAITGASNTIGSGNVFTNNARVNGTAVYAT